MAKTRDLTPAQQLVIRKAARKVWDRDFAHIRARRKTETSSASPSAQESFALALGISQTTVSALLDPRARYAPGSKVAQAVANLNGKTLNDLFADYGIEAPDELDDPEGPGGLGVPLSPSASGYVPALVPPVGPGLAQAHAHAHARDPFPNLTLCVSFFASSKTWSPWTIAAARAGICGPTDFLPPEWAPKLDALEKALAQARPELT